MATKTLLATGQRPKRTRVGVKQSKLGCFTCKARRIKCDEEKPTCQRCSRSKRICEKYPPPPTRQESSSASPPPSALSEVGHSLSHSTDSCTLLQDPLYDGFRRTVEQDRLSQLGCRLLAYDRYDKDWRSDRFIWATLLPQLGRAIPVVNAAAAALGAVYELQFLSNGNDQAKLAVESQYSVALRTLQRDIMYQPHGPMPLLLAVIMLTCTELVQRRQFNALAHLEGAFKILSNYRHVVSESALPDDGLENRRPPTPAKGSGSENTLDVMFKALDIQTSSYVLSRPPELPPSPLAVVQMHPRHFRNMRHARDCLVDIIHSCYHFTAGASEYKYLPRTSIPAELLVEQGRHIGHLSSWLRTLDRDISPTHRHGKMLRAQCLVTMIYASTVMSPFEKVYDNHSSSFQQIIQSSAAALDNEEPLTGLGQFFAGAELGTMQPLFFTAIKYRHSIWRRRAVELLRRGGREGPWDGKVLAAVASRAVEIEEADVDVESGEDIRPEHITDRKRVHGCAIDAEYSEGRPMNVVGVRFSHCFDVGEMLSAKVPWGDMSNWSIWDEDLTF